MYSNNFKTFIRYITYINSVAINLIVSLYNNIIHIILINPLYYRPDAYREIV